MKKVLITGFDPFGGEKINPAWEAVKRISEMEEVDLVKLQIPTSFQKAAEKVILKIEEENPDIIICVGQAGGSYEVLAERVAINIADGRIADNDGYQPVDEIIQENGENAYFSSLEIKKIVLKLKEAGIPAAVSNSAGTYVCNYVLYSVLHYIQEKKKNTKAGFIHLPYLPEQVLDKRETPYMELSTMVKALELIVKTCI